MRNVSLFLGFHLLFAANAGMAQADAKVPVAQNKTQITTSLDQANKNASHLALGILTFLPTSTVNSPYFDAQYFFDIPQQELNDALSSFALQSQATLAMNRELAGKLSTPVYGLFSPRQALETLLSRHAVSLKYNADNTHLIIWQQVENANGSPQAPQELKEDSISAEELLVKGIRASMARAMDIKLHESSIVDTATKEDIGKFPDSNLAEAVQRIPGVSLTHEDNEGSTISVRGMDPEFGLVTLNGRQLPSVYSRSFDFSSLSADNIYAVKVHKTFEAHHNAGATSAMIDIETSRPFDLEPNTFSIGGKIVNDSLNEKGKDYSPELSGFYSTKNNEENFGILLSATYQAREGQTQYATMDWAITDTYNLGLEEDMLSWPIWYPNEFYAGKDNFRRKRTNAQIAVQYAPQPNLTTTFDYTYATRHVVKDVVFGNMAFDGNNSYVDALVIYDNESNSSYFDETVISTYEAPGNYTFGKSKSDEITELNSYGINFSFQLNDSIHINVDAYDAVSKQHPEGNASYKEIKKVARGVASQSFSTENEIPYLYNEYYEDIFDETGTTTTTPSLNHFIRSNNGTIKRDLIESYVNEIKLDLAWENPKNSLFDKVMLGFSHSKFKVKTQNYGTNLYDPDENLDLSLQDYNTHVFSEQENLNILSQFSGDLGPSLVFYDFDINELAQAIAMRTENAEYATDPQGNSLDWTIFSQQHTDFLNASQILEKIYSAYMQVNLINDSSFLPFEVFLGTRYEYTSGRSEETSREVTDIRWLINEASESIFIPEFSNDLSVISESFDYKYLLPSVTIKLHTTDSSLIRMAYSKSISRPSTFLLGVGPDYGSYSIASWSYPVVRGNPALLPYTTKNLDFSFEWYYNDSSYLSLARFRKIIDNYPAPALEEVTSNGVRDVYGGPRVIEAQLELWEKEILPTDEAIFNLITENDEAARIYGLTGDENDPLWIWSIATLVNDASITAKGWEFIVQHIFEESGFGFALNYTLLDSDQKIGDRLGDLQVFSDFTLPANGSRDTANIVGFYENGHLQFRLAYHWNREYPRYQPGSPNGTVLLYDESHGQLDALVSYTFDKFTVTMEGFNLNNSMQRTYASYPIQFADAKQNGARYAFGLRYNF